MLKCSTNAVWQWQESIENNGNYKIIFRFWGEISLNFVKFTASHVLNISCIELKSDAVVSVFTWFPGL